MCSQRSRIPVFSVQVPKVINVAEELQPLPPSRTNLNRTANIEPHRDHAFVFRAKAPEHIAFKGATQGVTKVEPPPPKRAAVQHPVSRYRREAELRNKIKLLEGARSEMMVKLERTQATVNELKEQCENLQRENQEFKQFAKCCMLDQETRNCLSVAGGKTLEMEEMKEEQAEMMVLTEKLNTDLELLCKMVKEQKDNLQTAKMTWKQLEEERAHFREKQQCFQREMKEFADILDQEYEFVTAEMETTILTPL
ncbi:uncharacterized protein LOC125425747 [Sphaerodactylus townsendi]|uniref:uncharacterized protein LOC125425747 n=1 Tax=Sphaerodactylus townsendi TaxID=933632 RepID=UPI0020266D04|nr:uncharacterized protein LOC125425747 [Sphaerodactylus townsendi]XP_048339288.1 uncharacterized protein LOC125425747 [Sphaerodactylus townsendi]